ncbi:MAG TPA: hypothetical protein VFY16_04575 [Gemmatimonadaceae bacterium]|nr:hypothetical protein [Gemmatimonadaceae bacterium]
MSGAPAERHREIPRTARYFVVGQPNARVRRVWLACHGYGQLARDFAASLTPLAEGGDALVVAPEGLSRFYLDRGDIGPHAGIPVGASWMTREDREHEIADYVRWLDDALAHAMHAAGAAGARVHALGFSQGAATIARWVARTHTPPDALVLWAGLLPPELEQALGAEARPLGALPITTVAGRHDRLLSSPDLDRQEALLRRRGHDVRTLRFDGGHRVDEGVLREIAAG